MPSTESRITRKPRAYDLFLTDASIHAMYLLEDDEYMTLDEAVAETIGAAKWARTPDGASFILKHSENAPTASTVPDDAQLSAAAFAALYADLMHELVEECGLDPELFE